MIPVCAGRLPVRIVEWPGHVSVAACDWYPAGNTMPRSSRASPPVKVCSFCANRSAENWSTAIATSRRGGPFGAGAGASTGAGAGLGALGGRAMAAGENGSAAAASSRAILLQRIMGTQELQKGAHWTWTGTDPRPSSRPHAGCGARGSRHARSLLSGRSMRPVASLLTSRTITAFVTAVCLASSGAPSAASANHIQASLSAEKPVAPGETVTLAPSMQPEKG
ncbi:hypothetical protein OY671_009031, partial [Metschnikowia pulcherrima]